METVLTPPPASATPHRPLSQELSEVLAAEPGQERLTLNAVFQHTEGRGVFFLIIVLCLPFLGPVSVPGASNILGLIMLWLGVRLAAGSGHCLPRFLGERPLPAGFHRALRASIKILRFLEKWVRPRRSIWMRWPATQMVNGCLIGVMAGLLALPVPPVIPLTNMLPGYAILLLALSMMEEDGVLIWVAYAASALTAGYFFVWAQAIVHFTLKYYEPVLNWLRSWL